MSDDFATGQHLGSQGSILLDAGEAAATSTAVAADELEPQLKYERLGADVKTILQDASATCLCLSEKVLALGTSAGNIHILDYSGNEVRGVCVTQQTACGIIIPKAAQEGRGSSC